MIFSSVPLPIQVSPGHLREKYSSCATLFVDSTISQPDLKVTLQWWVQIGDRPLILPICTFIWLSFSLLRLKNWCQLYIDFRFHFNLRVNGRRETHLTIKKSPHSVYLYLRHYRSWDIVEHHERRGVFSWMFLEWSISSWDTGLKPCVLPWKLLWEEGTACPLLAPECICNYSSLDCVRFPPSYFLFSCTISILKCTLLPGKMHQSSLKEQLFKIISLRDKFVQLRF